MTPARIPLLEPRLYQSGHSRKVQLHLNRTYPCSSSFLVEPEVESIHSMGNCVALHPLISIISTLNSDLNHDCSASKVNLEPLSSVVVTCNPWAKSWTSAHGIQSALIGCIMSIVDWWCCEGDIGQATVFRAKWDVTTLWNKERYLNTLRVPSKSGNKR